MVEELKPVTWSYSGMKNFQGCPRRYHEVNVLKNYPFVETPQTIYGKKVHKAIEDYFTDGLCLPDEYAAFKTIVEKFASIGGERLPEVRLAVDVNGEPVDFFNESAWVRGIADLLIVSKNGKRALIVDWKTGGKNYPDISQLELMFLLARSKYPAVEQFDCYLVFLAHGVRVHGVYTQADTGKLWDYWTAQSLKLQEAHEKQEFNPKPSALCPWCPVVTCRFNKAKK